MEQKLQKNTYTQSLSGIIIPDYPCSNCTSKSSFRHIYKLQILYSHVLWNQIFTDLSQFGRRFEKCLLCHSQCNTQQGASNPESQQCIRTPKYNHCCYYQSVMGQHNNIPWTDTQINCLCLDLIVNRMSWRSSVSWFLIIKLSHQVTWLHTGLLSLNKA